MASESVRGGVRLLQESIAVLHASSGPQACEADRLAVLTGLAAAEHQMHLITVNTVAALQRDGSFRAHGQRAITGLADLLGVEYRDARRIVVAAEHVCPRVDLQGQVLPALLPATAAAFHAGTASLRHVDSIVRLMTSTAAERLPLDVRGDAEAQIAAMAADTTPATLRTWGAELIALLDQDGAEPDDREPVQVNEMFLTPNPDGSGGRIKGRIDDAALYEAIASVLDAKSAPLTKDDQRPLGQRQAEAMAEVFGYVIDHAGSDVLPSVGGNRPHLNIHIRLEDLEARALAAMLDFGGQMTPAALRMACCDACLIPIVLRSSGQPLDVGRKQRTVPDPLRRAVAARDRGCAHPGCDRLPSWCHIHHVIPWEHGGRTDLDNLVMLCSTHHREIHSSEWVVKITTDGQVEFVPPKWIDPDQKPRRKPPPPPIPQPSD